MKRWILVSCLALISALCVLVPAGAQASTLAGGQLASGKPVAVTISSPGQRISYTFAAAKGKHVTFQVTNFKLTDGSSSGSATLFFYEPGATGTNYYTACSVGSNTYCNFTPAVTGTWSVQLQPYGPTVGSLTLTVT